MRWVKLTLPPVVRNSWLLMMVRLTSSSLAGTARTLVAVGTAERGLHVGHDAPGRAAERHRRRLVVGWDLGRRRGDPARSRTRRWPTVAPPERAPSRPVTWYEWSRQCRRGRGGERAAGRPVVGEELPPRVRDRRWVGPVTVVHVLDQPGVGSERPRRRRRPVPTFAGPMRRPSGVASIAVQPTGTAGPRPDRCRDPAPSGVALASIPWPHPAPVSRAPSPSRRPTTWRGTREVPQPPRPLLPTGRHRGRPPRRATGW